MKKAKLLWEKLTDIAIDENDNIDQDFLHFKKGTHKFEIWHWFEDEFDLSVAIDLMGLEE